MLPPNGAWVTETTGGSTAHATDLGNDVRQTWVAQQQPAAGSDTVRLVLELLWPQLVEILEAVQ